MEVVHAARGKKIMTADSGAAPGPKVIIPRRYFVINRLF